MEHEGDAYVSEILDRRGNDLLAVCAPAQRFDGELLPELRREGGGRMSIEVRCDLCKAGVPDHEPVYVFRMWDMTVREYAVLGVNDQPFSDEYQLCGECMDRLFESSVGAKVVDR